MIELFVTNIGSYAEAFIDYIFTPWLQYMMTNPIVGFGFICFVIYGFVAIFLQIKNLFKGGLTP